MRRIFTLTALITAALLVMGVSLKIEKKEKKPSEKELCNTLYKGQFYDQALPHCQAALAVEEKDDEKAGLYSKIGYSFYKMKQYDDAARVLKDGAMRFPKDKEIHAYLSFSYIAQGRLDEALSEATIVTTLYPDHPSAWYAVGNVYVSQKRWGNAIEALATARALAGQADPEHCKIDTSNPRCGDIDFQMGLAYEGLVDFKSAARCFQRAANLNPLDNRYKEALARANASQ